MLKNNAHYEEVISLAIFELSCCHQIFLIQQELFLIRFPLLVSSLILNLCLQILKAT